MMLLRANSLARGYSGVRVVLVELLLELLNHDITPVVPEKGSLGASGDLAPLAHIALVLVGDGEAWYKGERLPGGEALRRAGLSPVVPLAPKEGLALVNGTQAMTAIGALAVWDSLTLLKTADVATALSFEALRGVLDALDERTFQLRPHAGPLRSARNLRRLLEGSGRVTRQGEVRVQDGYSLRCAPQVHGAARDILDVAWRTIEVESNAVTDNPLVFTEESTVLSGSNFHGQPVAVVLDALTVALVGVEAISERRIERMLNPALSGLPPFLAEQSGLQSGLMVAQYTAAALVSESKVLAHPASADSIPTSAGQEDHVSMGNHAARKLREVVWNLARVLAIELICAAQAVDLEKVASKLAPATRAAYEEVREVAAFLKEDRPLGNEIDELAERILAGRVVAAVQSAGGGVE
jgi:histidine ammonia-lyase